MIKGVCVYFCIKDEPAKTQKTQRVPQIHICDERFNWKY